MPEFLDGQVFWVDESHVFHPLGHMTPDTSFTLSFDGSRDDSLIAAIYGDLIAPKKESKPVSRLHDIQARMAELEAEAAAIGAYGADVYDEGDILKFKCEFDNRPGQVYTYAAIKGGGSWWLTGRTVAAHSWDELVALWRRGHTRKVRVVTESRKVVDL